MIIAVAGLLIPYIIREQGKNWTLVGFAYVHGVMDGETWNEEHEARPFTFL